MCWKNRPESRKKKHSRILTDILFARPHLELLIVFIHSGQIKGVARERHEDNSTSDIY